MAGNRITWDIRKYNPDTHYVYRSDSPMDPNSLPTPIATLGQGISVYKDTNNIVEGNTYYYRVDAEKMGLYIPGYEIEHLTSSIFIYIAKKFPARIEKYDRFLNQVESFPETEVGSYFNDIIVDASGNIYGAADELNKFDPDGKLLWSFTGHSSRIWDIYLGDNGNIYTASFDNTVRIINNDGNEIQLIDGHTDYVRAVVTDNNGYVYSGSSDGTVRKTKISNNYEYWSFSGFTGYIASISIDKINEYLYCGSSAGDLVKLDFSGNNIWTTAPHTDSIRAIQLDSLGNIYTGSNDETVKKVDSSGTVLWTFDSNANGNPDGFERYINDISIDYRSRAIFVSSSATNMKKIDMETGSHIETFNSITDFRNPVYITNPQ